MKLFVIAVGGTGMRCLEAFIHLCAIGMFDGEEIEVLTLDTDQSNGNKARSEQLLALYNRIKSSGGNDGGTPNSNTFFSAKLNLNKFFLDYSSEKRKNYQIISKLAEGESKNQEDNKLLSDLFLDDTSVQLFNLAHGYRAQTHLGSLLMYHGIVEAARNLRDGKNISEQEKSLGDFMEKLLHAGGDARVFVFGSVFGGTGASSIPVIPKAFQDFIKVRSGGTSNLDFNNTKFGSTLLTDYFSFEKPNLKHSENKDDSIIADASFFPLNSQAALQFYQSDPTVQRSYKLLYHIGWPVDVKTFESSSVDGKPITGGGNQKNPCHITELLCACAAHEFFNRTNGFDAPKAQYLYKAVEFKNKSFNFNFNDFVGYENEAGKTFANRLGAFFSLAHIVLSLNEGAIGGSGISGFITRFEKSNINEYSSITHEERNELNDYFKYFAYSFSDGKFSSGWLYQVRSTISPGTFMFDNSAFTTLLKELKDIDVGALFADTNNHWPKGGVFSSRYDKFVDTLINVKPNPNQKVTTTKEKFLAHIYNAITNSQGLIKN